MNVYDYSQPYVTQDEYLEVKGVNLAIELQDDDNASNKVNRFIQDLTNFVLDHLVMEYGCNELNRQTHDFEDLAEFRRKRFHYGMLEQIEYVLNNGLIQLNSGINMETGSITDFSAVVIGPSALKQFRLGGFCNIQEKSVNKTGLSPREYTIAELVLALSRKVDKVDGKGLSTNDFTTAYKNLINDLSKELDKKVDKVIGKVLSDNNFTNALLQKLNGIEALAQVNKIEEVRVNNVPLTISGKTVNIPSSGGGGGGATYTGGTGINVDNVNNIISADTDVLETKAHASDTYETKADAENIRQVAAGKCKTYVINTQSEITGTKGSDDQYTNVTAITGVTIADLKIGDNILIKELDKPDYWVSALNLVDEVITSVALNKLETSKVDLTDYATKDEVNDLISDEYDSTHTYNVGDVCIHENVLHKCNTNGTTGAWDSSKWDATTVAELVSDETIIKLDTGTYTANTPMSANDLAFFQPLLNMNTEQALKYLGNKLYFRLDNSRNEVHTTSYFSVRGTTTQYASTWYDIQIIFPIGSSITLTSARLENGTY